MDEVLKDEENVRYVIPLNVEFSLNINLLILYIDKFYIRFKRKIKLSCFSQFLYICFFT